MMKKGEGFMTSLGACAFDFYCAKPSHSLVLTKLTSVPHPLLLVTIKNMLINSLKDYCEPYIFLKGGRSKFYVEQNVF